MKNTLLYEKIMNNVALVVKKALNEDYVSDELKKSISDYDDVISVVLKKRLNDGIVNFSFNKADGTVREATGTTNLDIISSLTHNPTILSYIRNKSYQKNVNIEFFDTEKCELRQCKAESLIKIVDETPADIVTDLIDNASYDYDVEEFSMENGTIEDLKELLHTGVAHFSFTKKDGTIREVYATTNLNIMPQEFQPKGTTTQNGTPRAKNPNIISIFDLINKKWISAIITNIL